jgi:hypothetical protein
MDTDHVNPLRRNRAVTLIEAVLYISIALALIVGGLVFFQQASTAAKTSTMVRQWSALLAESRVLVKGIPLTAIPSSMTSFLISAGAVPPDMVGSPTTMTNPFGGTVVVQAFAPQTGSDYSPAFITIIGRNIPQGVCARLLIATAGLDLEIGSTDGATTVVSSGFVAGGVAPAGDPDISIKYWAMNATQAGWMCKYGAANYVDKTAEPGSAPISGNVAIAMQFLVDR